MTSWTKELDEAAILATQKGCWHVLLFYLLCGLASIPTSFLVFSQVFTNATPEHWCAPPPELEIFNLSDSLLRNLTVPDNDGVYESCSSYTLDTKAVWVALSDYKDKRNPINDESILQRMEPLQLPPVIDSEEYDKQISRIVEVITSLRGKQTPCINGWKFSTEEYTKTLVTEYSLVCEREWLPRMSNTLFWVGSIFGNIFFGWMSDSYGRRPTTLLIICLEVPLAIAAAFPSSYTTYISLRVVSGLFFPAMYQIPFVLAMELMPPAQRTNAGIIVGMLFAGGISLLALIAYAVPDWFHLTLATSVPFIILYGYYWVIPESPRWLVGRGRFAEAEMVLRRLAKKNGINLAPGFILDIHEKIKREENTDEMSITMSEINGNVLGFPEMLNKSEIDFRINNKLLIKPDITIISEIGNDTDNQDRLLTNNENRDSVTQDKERLKNEEEYTSDSELRENTKQTNLNNNSLNKKSKKGTLRIYPRKLRKYEITGHSKIHDLHMNEDCKATVLDLFRHPNMRKKFLILTFDWLSIGVIYNTLIYNTSNLGVNVYLAFFISGAVELPSYIMAWRLMERFGRRWVLCIFTCVGGLACLSCVLVPEDMPWITLSLAMLGRLCAAASFAVFYVVIGEILPTVLRSQAMGLVSFIAGLGLLCCPHIVHLTVYLRVLPLLLMGVLSILVGVTSLLLPETLNQPLPQTVEDGEMFGKDFQILSCVSSNGD